MPYTVNALWGMELGNATIAFHLIMLAIWALIERKNFKITNLIGFVFAVFFGKYITLCNILLSPIFPNEPHIIVKIIFLCIGILLTAI